MVSMDGESAFEADQCLLLLAIGLKFLIVNIADGYLFVTERSHHREKCFIDWKRGRIVEFI